MRVFRLVAILSLALGSCGFDRGEHVQACEGHADCRAGSRCYDGFCLAGGGAAGTTDLACGQGSQIETCYEGPAETRDVGACASGQRICIGSTLSECLGQMLPVEELCNAKDDDCDTRVDEVESAVSCDTRLRGACAEGTRACRDGVEVCEPMRESQAESCNAIDDDCDGTVDEITTDACYPDATAGCARDSTGAFQCQGLCATGLAGCASSVTCNGAITPAAEVCTEAPALAQDENCDGQIDENCGCSDGQTRDCYSGPLGTLHGECQAGSQTCSSSEWGECIGEVVPQPETCQNAGADDDCNQTVDDVPGRGEACVASDGTGQCREGIRACVAGESTLECVAGEPSDERCDDIDQDCDGNPINGFDFTSDDTCGDCDVRCLWYQTCCGGSCILTSRLQDDIDNCGACGRACGDGQYCCQGDCLSVATTEVMACDCSSSCGSQSCCGTSCLDLENDQDNCGACGRRCMRNQTCQDGACQ